MAIREFDVFVIGTGTAGKTVAYACAEAGKNVAIADDRAYGGTCANRGCDPKKVLVGLTEILDRSENMLGFGLTHPPQYSWKDLMAFKKTFTDPVPYVHEKNLKKAGITLFHQSPYFIDSHTLSVEGKTISAKKVVIATGQKPRTLKIPGRDELLVSDDFLSLDSLPQSMVFVGGGFVGMELSHIAARMGVKVTLIHSGPRPLKHFDSEMVDYLVEASKSLGIQFIFNAVVHKIEKKGGNYEVLAKQDKQKKVVTTDRVINTAGRVPSIDHLKLEKGNVQFSKKGIIVNENLQSPSNKDVFACGDVADSQGKPLSPYEAKMVISQLLNKKKNKKSPYPVQPSAVYTLPHLAAVGLTEEKAKREKIDYIVKTEKVPQWYTAKREHTKWYAYKTIMNKKDKKILGAHLVGPEAAETINLFTMAINSKLTTSQLKKMIFAYPTRSGDIQSMIG